ncbi:BZ3500_MvSof-1268-A1-R1_Chr3-3g06600 [Microbotryum saponariae]|uniref:BZ3500_MvSof-1268-A1-R1_Chr3-3g06600 protein n=1 Tax=Microbotryum saponariae TaxID=289078 RepID=A0A2X0NHF4_9BASI|nr:BZ3500_MvSof-1268-A1-R1_Chr3-3g06600 [Microbotryum saponariae]SDA04567.1 BZ3501_MvSof-1269-A2-R1_Chr3-2g06287 [Microbotryum saponariae]
MPHAQLGETRCSDEQRAPLGSASTSQWHNRHLPPHARRVSRVTRLRSLGSSLGESHDGDHEIEWAGLEDFFLAPLTDDIDTTVVPEIVWEDGKPRLKSRGRLLSFQEDNQSVQVYDPSVIPDVVLLTREVFEADPSLVATWTSDDKDGYDDTRSWSQVAAVAEISRTSSVDPSDSDSDILSGPERLRESLSALVSQSLRSHAFGFLLCDNILEMVLHTPSGRFCSPTIYCTEANGDLATFLARLLSLSDRELGIISSLRDRVDSASFSFPSCELPSRVPLFDKRLSGSPPLEDIRFLETLYKSDSIFGRHTSAFRVSTGGEGSTAHVEYAMTVSFVEEARCDEHDRIRLAIANASPEDRQGLTNTVDVYRESDFVVVPHFLPSNLPLRAAGLKPRAMEMTFHEHCFEPICVVDSTEALTRVILGAVREGEAECKKKVGTLAYRARELVEEHKGRPTFLHQPWHDIESLVYVTMFAVFIQPNGPDDSSELSDEIRSIWQLWNSKWGAVDSKTMLFLAPWGPQELFEPFKEFWKEDLATLVQTVAKYCGLGVQRTSWAAPVDEDAILVGQAANSRTASWPRT